MKNAQRFWILWVTFSAVFISMSFSVVDMVERPIISRLISSPITQEVFMVLGLALLSSFIGIVQSILLRPYLRHAGQWSLATGITYWVGGSLAEIASFTGIGLLPSYALSIILLGPICGVWQSRILHSQIKNSGWWILAQTASWLALFAVTVIFVYGYYALLGGNSTWITPAGYALGGLAFGAVTASVLVRLLSLDRLGDLSISSGGY